MLTIYSNDTVSLNHRHIGSVKQESDGTAFYTPKGERHVFPRITLSKPDKAGWSELEAALRGIGLIDA